jgi:hypothetical protein
MGTACSTHGIYYMRIMFRREMTILEINIQMRIILNWMLNRLREIGPDSCDSMRSPVTGFVNALLSFGFNKGWEFLYHMCY